jgi:aminoglycoside phosphotransferase (APT) family kinase protein
VTAGAAARAAAPGIDQVALDAWFAGNVEGARPPLHFEVITGGRSNITYRVRDSAGSRFVLRRPPLGHVLATAHDMAREHRIIGAVGKTAVPVPDVVALCEDVEVNGAPFYVMSFVDGHVLATAEDTNQALPDVASRWRIGEHVADIMADLHTVDVDAVGLGDLARREGFLDRQLKRWRGQWEQSKTRDLPDMEAAFDLLMAHKPEQRYTGIVHGDFRIGNMLAVVAGEPVGAPPTPAERDHIAAVLDWELCTLGDVLADVGYFLNYWATADGDDAESFVDPPPTAAGGFPSRDEIVERYAARSGFDLSDVEYYRAFSYWRSAAIVEGVKRRYIEGVMVDDEVDPVVYDRRVVTLAALSRQRITTLVGSGGA